MHASGVQLGDLAAAHQTESNIKATFSLAVRSHDRKHCRGSLEGECSPLIPVLQSLRRMV